MRDAEFIVETCTLHDDEYLNFVEQHQQNKSINDCNHRPFEAAGVYSYSIQNESRFIIWLA
jgi:hypothetical protein